MQKFNINKKASFFFTLDAIISFFLVLSALYLLYQPEPRSLSKDLLANDLVNLVTSLSNVKVYEIQNQSLRTSISSALDSDQHSIAEALVLLNQSGRNDLVENLSIYISNTFKPKGRAISIEVIDSNNNVFLLYKETLKRSEIALTYTLPILIFSQDSVQYYFLRITLEV